MKISPVFWLIPFLPVFFVALWTGIIFILSQMGWSPLAQSFSTQSRPTGKTFPMASASINGCNYNNCLTARVTESGLWLQPWLPFRMFHPALIIPWQAFTAFEEQKILWARRLSTTVATPEGRRVKLVLMPRALEIAIIEKLQLASSSVELQADSGPWSS